MFIRFTLKNGTKMWLRAASIFSVEKQAENKIVTMVQLNPQTGYAVEESQEDIVEAICEAVTTNKPVIVKENAQAESPPGRILS